MSSIDTARVVQSNRRALLRTLDVLGMPGIASLLAFVGGALIIWITSGNFETILAAYGGMIQGAFFKTRGLSESLVATVPYILLSLGLALGFKAGLFNIGVEGQFTMGALAAAWAGAAFNDLPAIIHLPLAIGAGALAGAVWAGIPGFLKAKTGAHEVINTIMMNYIAFRFAEFVVSGPLRDPRASAVQTPRVSPNAELWSMWQIPDRLSDPLNALAIAIIFAIVACLVARWLLAHPRFATVRRRRAAMAAVALLVGLVTLAALPIITRNTWLFTDKFDRLHVGIFLALAAAIAVWWLLWRTTLGFEMRTVGANPDAARYAGINLTRIIIVSMMFSGALAGIAGTVEVLGVSICRCLPLFFSSGYGFDSIAIALLAQNNPFAIIVASFFFGAMRNGADLMELNSGVSKHVISLIQALVLLFVAAPAMVRWLLRMRAVRRLEVEAPLTRGWG